MSFLINKQRSVSENLVTRSQSEKRDQLYVLAVKTTNRTDYCQPRGNRERRECGREVRWRSEKRGDRYLTSGTLASGSHRFEKQVTNHQSLAARHSVEPSSPPTHTFIRSLSCLESLTFFAKTLTPLIIRHIKKVLAPRFLVIARIKIVGKHLPINARITKKFRNHLPVITHSCQGKNFFGTISLLLDTSGTSVFGTVPLLLLL